MENGLLLNPSKSQVIPIAHKLPQIDSLPSINLSGCSLKIVKSATNLGFIINTSLSGSEHTNFIIRRVYGCLRKLWITASFTSTNTRLRLVKTLILPLITYAENVYCDSDSLSQRKLQVAFNDAVRYIYGLRRCEHVSPYMFLLFLVPRLSSATWTLETVCVCMIF